MNQVWNQYGSDFIIGENTTQKKKLPVGIYNINQHPMTKELSLSLVSQEFTFPYKVYGMEDKFVKRMRKTYEATEQNMGILLNGVKGSGKSVVAKQICNTMDMPIIIVDRPYDGLVRFLNIIEQDVLVFIDEYEKVYKNSSEEMLTIMDGVHSNQFRRTFLLTTNYLYISPNLLQRPGRLRYVKTFGDLAPSVVEEIVDDILLFPEFREDIIMAVSRMSIITIDLVKALVNETNIHEESPKEFISFLNVKKPDNEFGLYSAYEVVDGELSKKACLTDLRLNSGVQGLTVGQYVYDSSDNYVAKVTEKFSSDIFKVRWGLAKVQDKFFDEETGAFDKLKWDEDMNERIVTENVGEEMVYYYICHNGSVVDRWVDKIVKITEDSSKHYMYTNFKFAY